MRLNRLRVILSLMLVTILFGLVGLTGCSIRSLVVKQLEPVVAGVQYSILSETETEIVDGSIPFAIKLTEGIYHYYPDSPYYSGKLAFLYAAYTFIYIDKSPYSDFDDNADDGIAKATQLYERAFQYGLKSLETRYPGFSKDIFKSDKVDNLLAQVEREAVETLFWFNFSWALKLFYNLDDVATLVHLETIRKIAERIEVLYPDYLYGANKSIFIAFYGGRVASLGGDPKKAKQYYQDSLKMSEGKSVVNEFVYLRFVTTQSSSSKEFDLFYNKIINFKLDQNPDFYYVNKMIQKKARDLNKKKDQFF